MSPGARRRCRGRSSWVRRRCVLCNRGLGGDGGCGRWGGGSDELGSGRGRFRRRRGRGVDRSLLLRSCLWVAVLVEARELGWEDAGLKKGEGMEEKKGIVGRRTDLGAVSVLVGVHPLDVVGAPRAVAHGRTPTICPSSALTLHTPRYSSPFSPPHPRTTAHLTRERSGNPRF